MSDERETSASPGGDEGSGGSDSPDRAVAPDRDARIRELAREMEENGWSGSPLVVHGDRILGGRDRYDAARFAGMEHEVPRITLEEVFEEAGMDLPQIASNTGGTSPGEEMFQDYLRDLPRHISDKYEL